MHLTRATTGKPSIPDIRILEYLVLSRNIEYYSSFIFTSSSPTIRPPLEYSNTLEETLANEKKKGKIQI